MINDQEFKPKVPSETATRDVILITITIFLLAIFVILRKGIQWGEMDTATYTGYIQATIVEGKLVPQLEVNENGYGYQALADYLIQISGMSLQELQLYASALLVIWMVIPAWLLCREFTGSRRAASLATVILFIQPEFLFPILRGTHEKFTRGLMMLCLYLLLRSLRSQNRMGRFLGFLVSFYLAGYAMITFNNLMSTSFIMAIGIALVITWIIQRIMQKGMKPGYPITQRLTLVLGSLMVVAFIFTFYAYIPAQHQLVTMKNVFARIMALLLPASQNFEPFNPYLTVSGGWISVPVYWLISLANWLLLTGSAAIWLSKSYRWLLRRQIPHDQREVLLWAFYGAFTLIGAISLVADISGALASNLQLRAFPTFCMVAAPLVGEWLAELKPRPGWRTNIAQAGLAFGLAFLAIVSVIKATNEPLVSNKWGFYMPLEMAGLNWSINKSPNSLPWTDFDERLITAYVISSGARNPVIINDLFAANRSPRNIMVSEVTRSRSLRLGISLPISYDDLMIYDNGQAQIYHIRPKTPYQQ